MARHGWMLINLQDHYMGHAIATYGEYSQLETEFILQWMPAGRDVVEVGANMGTISLPLAQACAEHQRRLMVIEPQPVIFQQLCANLALNGLRNVQAIHGACSQQATQLYFQRPRYDQPGNFGALSLRSEALKGDETIEAKPLDDWIDDSWDVGLIKIDVEGMESLVLQGASRILQRSSCVLYVENDQPSRSQALIEQLWALDFRVWFHLPPHFNPANFAGQQHNLFPNTVSVNMLCLPPNHPQCPAEPPISDSTWHPLTAARAAAG